MTMKPCACGLQDAALRPTHQEGGNVLRILLEGFRRAVVIGDLTVGDRLRHGKRLAGDKVRVVVRAFGNLDAFRRLW